MSTSDPKSKAGPGGVPDTQPLDPSQLGAVTHFSGFAGRASKPENTRVFLTLDFDSYIEVASGDVVRTATVADPEKPLPQTHIWVRAGAAITHTAIDTLSGTADFVKGEIFGNCTPGTSPVDLSEQMSGNLAVLREARSRRCDSGRHSRRVCLCCPD